MPQLFRSCGRSDAPVHAVQGDCRGWASIHCTNGDHPYAAKWWVPGRYLGQELYFVHGLYEFLASLDAPKSNPDFRNALGTHHVCDAVLKRALAGRWIKVKRP